ncbi:hypothetical protein MMH89_04325 [Candidatus Comchoanobacter bicostacola]|uniref:DNA binding HTH domain-containing protein n=1 Tax=Candidatus Comchoanobacter bicostacola TaxID=2919598 RepID=A0ABY5DKM3_9GAMM|nr:helix-turn-helix domain-containing protein [Candidatus Comchoanobacter bicostacola]UTC24444.1 hypothetical protein MMH89_04325 [Candidatus Comchoanobacter bicostacola]
MNDYQHLQRLITQATQRYLEHAGTSGKLLHDFTHNIEKNIIETTLSFCEGNYSTTAQSLGISRTTLYSKLKKHNIIK